MGTCICGHRITAPEPEPVCSSNTCGCSYPQQADLEWTHTCHLDQCTKTLLNGHTCQRCGRTQ